ncbi:MAG TPA: hypothetical protein VF541_22530 [Longimicrobium sp.]|jgi:hypothetical protein
MRNREHDEAAAGAGGEDGAHPAPHPAPKPSPVRVEPPLVDEDEMGGEAPCQLHRFWDVDE